MENFVITAGIILIVILFIFLWAKGKKDQEKRKLQEQEEFEKIERNKKNILREQKFNSDKNVATPEKTLYIDNTKKVFCFFEKSTNVMTKNYQYSDLLKYDVQENGSSLTQGKGGAALAGGLLFGVTGAIIGASGNRSNIEKCESLDVYIFINDLQRPNIKIPIIATPIEKNKPEYKSATELVKELISTFEYIQVNSKSQVGI